MEPGWEGWNCDERNYYLAWWERQPARSVPMERKWGTKYFHFSLFLPTRPLPGLPTGWSQGQRRHGSLLVQSLQVSLSWVEYVCREYRLYPHATYPFFFLFHIWDREAIPAAHHGPLTIFSLPCYQLLPFNQLGPITGYFCSCFFHLTTITIKKAFFLTMCLFSFLEEMAFKAWRIELVLAR